MLATATRKATRKPHDICAHPTMTRLRTGVAILCSAARAGCTLRLHPQRSWIMGLQAPAEIKLIDLQKLWRFPQPDGALRLSRSVVNRWFWQQSRSAATASRSQARCSLSKREMRRETDFCLLCSAYSHPPRCNCKHVCTISGSATAIFARRSPMWHLNRRLGSHLYCLSQGWRGPASLGQEAPLQR